MSYSTVTYVSDGVTSEFTINFALGYISEDHVKAWVSGEVDGGGNKIYRDLTFLSKERVRISGSVPPVGVKIEFSRSVPKSEQIVVFNDGDNLDEDNLDTSQKQSMMATHEALDAAASIRLDADTAISETRAQVAAAVTKLKEEIDNVAGEVVFIFVERDPSSYTDAKHYVHTQDVAATVWTIDHNLNTYPGVTVFDPSGQFIVVEYSFNTLNQMRITFAQPERGVAYVH